MNSSPMSLVTGSAATIFNLDKQRQRLSLEQSILNRHHNQHLHQHIPRSRVLHSTHLLLGVMIHA